MTNRTWTSQGWEQPPVEDYQLGANVQVWRVTLVPTPAPLRLAGDILDDEEHVRAARLRRPRTASATWPPIARCASSWRVTESCPSACASSAARRASRR